GLGIWYEVGCFTKSEGLLDGKLLYHGQVHLLSASSRKRNLSWSGHVRGTAIPHFPRGMREQWSEFHIVPNYDILALLMLSWCTLREAILEVQLAFPETQS